MYWSGEHAVEGEETLFAVSGLDELDLLGF